MVVQFDRVGISEAISQQNKVMVEANVAPLGSSAR